MNHPQQLVVLLLSLLLCCGLNGCKKRQSQRYDPESLHVNRILRSRSLADTLSPPFAIGGSRVAKGVFVDSVGYNLKYYLRLYNDSLVKLIEMDYREVNDFGPNIMGQQIDDTLWFIAIERVAFRSGSYYSNMDFIFINEAQKSVIFLKEAHQVQVMAQKTSIQFNVETPTMRESQSGLTYDYKHLETSSSGHNPNSTPADSATFYLVVHKLYYQPENRPMALPKDSFTKYKIPF